MSCYIVDRIENGYAVCEDPDGKMTEIPLDQIETLPKEGEVLKPERGRYRVDAAASQIRKSETHQLYAKLKKKMGKGENYV